MISFGVQDATDVLALSAMLALLEGTMRVLCRWCMHRASPELTTTSMAPIPVRSNGRNGERGALGSDGADGDAGDLGETGDAGHFGDPGVSTHALCECR